MTKINESFTTKIILLTQNEINAINAESKRKNISFDEQLRCMVDHFIENFYIDYEEDN